MTKCPNSVLFLVFLVPGHLNRFELRLVRGFGIVVEAVEREDALAQISEAKRERIEIREFVRQRDADILPVRPLHDKTSSALPSLRLALPNWMPPPSCT